MKISDKFISSHRHGRVILEQEFPELWSQIAQAIESVSEDELIVELEKTPIEFREKSLSIGINRLLKERFETLGWRKESPIFQAASLKDLVDSNPDKWRLDFAKEDVSIEVAFNHAEAIAWNLIKPVLASELNHVDKAIQTQVGVIICATEDLKLTGGFDGAVGTFEGFSRYLIPLGQILTVPMVIIGLEGLESFHVEHVSISGKKHANVVRHD